MHERTVAANVFGWPSVTDRCDSGQIPHPTLLATGNGLERHETISVLLQPPTFDQK